MILASQSPRRLEILRDAGFDPQVMPADIDEHRLPGETPEELVRRLACQKAEAVAARTDGSDTILASDTVVWLPSGEVLGKPGSARDAEAMLRLLSGTHHFVSTGAAVLADGRLESLVDTVRVSFYPLSDGQIAAYVASGEPMDKAGSYGIQGRGRLLVEKIEGDFFTVMGLPITRIVRELLEPLGRPSLVQDLLGGTHEHEDA